MWITLVGLLTCYDGLSSCEDLVVKNNSMTSDETAARSNHMRVRIFQCCDSPLLWTRGEFHFLCARANTSSHWTHNVFCHMKMTYLAVAQCCKASIKSEKQPIIAQVIHFTNALHLLMGHSSPSCIRPPLVFICKPTLGPLFFWPPPKYHFSVWNVQYTDVPCSTVQTSRGCWWGCGQAIKMELNREYATPHFYAHTATDRRLNMHQMAVNRPQTLSYLGDERPSGYCYGISSMYIPLCAFITLIL